MAIGDAIILAVMLCVGIGFTFYSNDTPGRTLRNLSDSRHNEVEKLRNQKPSLRIFGVSFLAVAAWFAYLMFTMN